MEYRVKKLKQLLIVFSILVGGCNTAPSIKNISVTHDSLQSTSDTLNSVKDTLLNQKDNAGMKQGVWKEFYKNGQLKNQAAYVNDSIDGVYKSYFSDGTLESVISFSRGKYDGDYFLYYKTGKVKLYIKSKMDKRVYLKKCDPADETYFEEFYEVGKRYMSVGHNKNGNDTGRAVNWK